jgi:hypothetical protein
MGEAPEIRGAHGDVLHAVVREGYAALRAALEGAERGLPRFVEREVEGYLGCGEPSRGFAWLTCVGCATHRLVEARWVDELFPRVRVRQWVLTVPWRRRALFARRRFVKMA